MLRTKRNNFCHSAAIDIILLGTVFLLLGVGCSSNKQAADLINPALLEKHASHTDPAPYIIQSGDLLDIKFFYNREFNEDMIPVRPDGRIVLQLGQEVRAAGLTTEKLRRSLEVEYSKTLKDPEITIILREFSNKIFVDGEVNQPGELAVLGPVTALQAITRAGGATQNAQIDQVIVLRKGPDGTPLVYELNLEHALSGRDLSQDIALAPKDIVYVPLLAIANVNLWVDTYIRKNIPFRLGLTFFDF